MTDSLVNGKLVGSFSGTGQSSTLRIRNGALFLSFGSGTVVLERQSPQTGTWYGITNGSYTATASDNIDGRGYLYRLNCTSYTSTISYEIHGETSLE